jgi:hypothetical protein
MRQPDGLVTAYQICRSGAPHCERPAGGKAGIKGRARLVVAKILLRQLLTSVPARALASRRCFRTDSRRFRTTKCAARGALTDIQTILAL